METAWIQIFILTLAECVAPAGKSVCQQQQFELQFVNRTDCEYALQQLIASKDESEYVIVNREKSGCAASAVESQTFASRDAINEAYGDLSGWRSPDDIDARRSAVNEGHRDRLESLKSCEETDGKAPCRIGDIIVEEAAGDSLDVWKRD